jgi:hypothetical protein
MKSYFSGSSNLMFRNEAIEAVTQLLDGLLISYLFSSERRLFLRNLGNDL